MAKKLDHKKRRDADSVNPRKKAQDSNASIRSVLALGTFDFLELKEERKLLARVHAEIDRMANESKSEASEYRAALYRDIKEKGEQSGLAQVIAGRLGILTIFVVKVVRHELNVADAQAEFKARMGEQGED